MCGGKIFERKISWNQFTRMDVSITIDDLQPLIIEFSVNCSRDELIIRQLIKNNKEFRNQLEARKCREVLEQPNFLRKLLEHSLRRTSKGTHSKIHDDTTKDMSLYLFMTAGPLAYETLRKNLLLPSRTTVLNHLGKSPPVREGALQTDEIAAAIKKRGLSCYVWLAEDDTKMQSRMRYNSNDDHGTRVAIRQKWCPHPKLLQVHYDCESQTIFEGLSEDIVYRSWSKSFNLKKIIALKPKISATATSISINTYVML